MSEFTGLGRDRVDNRLSKLPNVSATSIGLKTVEHVVTDEICLIVHVSRKLRLATLSSNSNVIPKLVKLGGQKYKTDVVRSAKPWHQSAIAVQDGRKRGTLSCFAKRGSKLFLVTCAHVLMGRDNDPTTTDPVEIWSPKSRQWIEIGMTSDLLYESGSGVPQAFGFLDAGLAEISSSTLKNKVRNKPLLEVYPAPSSSKEAVGLLKKSVIGVGVLMGEEKARITELYWRSSSGRRRADMVIRGLNGQGLTMKGDSGVLWKTPSGRALAIHALGTKTRNGHPSKASYCMFMERLTNRLGVQLLDG